jgi:hypothetical protein
MEMLTNDLLITLVNGGPMGPLPKLAEAAQEELLRRLNLGKNQIDSLFDMDVINKQFDEIYCKIKDLHERIDQVTKKMLGEFGDAAIKAGSAAVFKGDGKVQWTDKDMLNFVGISISKDEAYLKKLLEEYRNA